jgi:hypothetical protein
MGAEKRRPGWTRYIEIEEERETERGWHFGFQLGATCWPLTILNLSLFP